MAPLKVLNLKDRPIKLWKDETVVHPNSEVTDIEVRTNRADRKVAGKFSGHLQS